jgi:hypothetical protein
VRCLCVRVRVRLRQLGNNFFSRGFICVLRRVGKLQLVGRCRYVVFMVLEKGFRDGGLKNEWFACIAFV